MTKEGDSKDPFFMSTVRGFQRKGEYCEEEGRDSGGCLGGKGQVPSQRAEVQQERRSDGTDVQPLDSLQEANL